MKTSQITYTSTNYNQCESFVFLQRKESMIFEQSTWHSSFISCYNIHVHDLYKITINKNYKYFVCTVDLLLKKQTLWTCSSQNSTFSRLQAIDRDLTNIILIIALLNLFYFRFPFTSTLWWTVHVSSLFPLIEQWQVLNSVVTLQCY